MLKKLKHIITCLIAAGMMLLPVQAEEDGAYVIQRSTSYVNPLTGVTQDGGENVELGDSMVQSIVESQLLVEQVNGQYYVTVGLGLASNVSNVRFQLMNAQGQFTSVSASVTGSSTANGDTVNHYRIPVTSLSDYISPIMYVNPMGRDVQFFITMNAGSMSKGTGIYNSLLVPEKEEAQPSVQSKPSASKTESSAAEKAEATEKEKETEKKAAEDEKKTEKAAAEKKSTKNEKTVTYETLFKDVTGLSFHTLSDGKKTKSQNTGLYLGIGAVVVLGAAGGLYYVKKKK